MKKSLGLWVVFFLLGLAVYAQDTKTENIIIVTLDGYRWQELFGGADQRILESKKYAASASIKNQFDGPSDEVRRQQLMPFFWNVIARQGQLYGNRRYRNKVNCKNNHLLSYPGYSEMLVGFNASEVSSNDKTENPNATVLEFIHDQKSFHKRVAAFATWDAFPYILREQKADIHVNAGMEEAQGNLSATEKKLNALQSVTQRRSDSITFQYAFEYLKKERPRVMFIGFDGTDYYGHRGLYDDYLTSAHSVDAFIGELWTWIQSQPDYKDKTTLLITTDHGRGRGKHNWKNHRLLATGSRHIWFAVLGPDTPAFGEMKFKAKYYQKQVAKTVAAFLGLPYRHKKPVGEIVQTMLAVPQQEGVPLSLSVDDDFTNNR